MERINRMASHPVPEVVIEERTGVVHISMNGVDAHALAVLLHAFDDLARTKRAVLQGGTLHIDPTVPHLSTPMILLRGILDRKLVGAPDRGAGETGTPGKAPSAEELRTMRLARRQELWTQLWYEDNPGDAAGGRVPPMPEELR